MTTLKLANLEGSTFFTLENARIGVFFPPILLAGLANGVIAILAYPMRNRKNGKTDRADNRLENLGSLLIFDDNFFLGYSDLLVISFFFRSFRDPNVRNHGINIITRNHQKRLIL